MAPTVESSDALLSLLRERDLAPFALERLAATADGAWADLADRVAEIEALYEEAGFAGRELAALVASKVRRCWRGVVLHIGRRRSVWCWCEHSAPAPPRRPFGPSASLFPLPPPPTLMPMGR